MGSKRQLFVILCVVLGAIFAYALIRAFGENDESRVRRAVYAGIVAFEKTDIVKCSPLISDAYEDTFGNNKTAVLRFLSEIFKDFKDFKVVVKKLKVRVKGAEAGGDVWFICYFKKISDEKLYYDSGKIEFGFVKEHKSWRVKIIEYSGSNELLFLQSVA
jgi:hypothetical protein